MHCFSFEAYGVKIRIESNRKRLFDRARSIAEASLLGNLTEIEDAAAEHVLGVISTGNTLNLIHNGSERSSTENRKVFFNFFESIVRVTVAEYAVGYVFIHAGVVAWKGKAIIFPANSYQGKTTLVAELVKLGATYYSDEYAVVDERGLVHPFARPLSVRVKERHDERNNVQVAALGGVAGREEVPVGAIILTSFKENAKWKPRKISPGNAIIAVIQQTIPINHDPDFAIQVLKTIAERAIIVSSQRGDVKISAAEILFFIDNTVI